MKSITQRLADELDVREAQVQAAVALLDEGATVPFIARYRKEVTGALSDTALRQLEERLVYLRELEDRRQVVLDSIREQDRLTPELDKAIREADSKSRLEDLYLPYKPKRRTRGQIAREQGLEPLALMLLETPDRVPEKEAEAYLNKDLGVETVEQALEGARFILMEAFSEKADVLQNLRDWLWTTGIMEVRVVEGQEAAAAKYQDYFAYDEALAKVPSHRALAVFRGRHEGMLAVRIKVPDEPDSRRDPHPAELRLAARLGIQDAGRPADGWLREVVRWTWRIKLYPTLETDLFTRLREAAEGIAIDVFAANLKDLLLAAPAGQHATMGLDPGLRTGVKVAVVDATGKLLAHTTVFPHAPRNQWKESLQTLVELCRRHNVTLISVGNGTASRETDKLAGEVVRELGRPDCQKVMVSEAGASVYSASAVASAEFPDLDVSFRGAVSIARRLQDPLAELVKIEPKAIGVGQYQHDVSQTRLARALDAVVEDCVNAVGVDLNTASAPLLARVSGLSTTVAEQIVAYREQHGAFPSRQKLLDVPRLGPKTYEQAAGFLRIMNGQNPLDGSAVHPEAYPVVERIAVSTGKDLKALIGSSDLLRTLRVEDFADEQFGVYTIRDVLSELEKPGRDPRPEFKVARYAEGVEQVSDLQPGMVLEGTVSNVTPFGAFVDVGVHQDGLVHVSALSHQFVKDPRDVVKAGDVVKVKVLEVDLKRQRISLTMRLDDPLPEAEAKAENRRTGGRNQNAGPRQAGPQKAGPQKAAGKPASRGTLGDLLLQAQQKGRSKA